MNIVIDLELEEVIQDFNNRNPIDSYEVKNQDTPIMAVYFVQRGTTYNLGPSPGIRFGLFAPGNPNPLVLCSSFTQTTDQNNRTCYRGYPNFNTVNLAGAMGSGSTFGALGEWRYQTSGGTITRTQDVSFTIQKVLLSETILDNTTAAFTVPAVGSNVTIAQGSTGWLSPGLIVTIGAGAGSYTVVSITDGTHYVAQNNGGTGNAAPTTVIPSGTTVGIAPATVLSTYPDPSIIELTTHKGAANGYAGLDANTLLLSSRVPVDGQTISNLASGKIGLSSILATIAANFVTPAANATVSVTLSSTTNLVAGMYVRIPIAGYYVVNSITSGTVAVLQNNGDPFNAGAGVTITTGAVLLPAQAAAGGSGTPGQNAFTTLLAGFVVPASGATVSVNLGSTSWLGGSGYVVFIAGAGYYAVSSITDATHAVLTNLGYAATNAIAGTSIPTGAAVSPGGLQGPASTLAGANAYDTTQASFVMPAAAATVNVTITNTGWLGVGQEVYIAGAGYFSVASITSATIFAATNSNYPGAAAPGSTIASGAHVSPAGPIGPAGAGGAGLNAFTTLSANFTQPAVNAAVTITVGTSAWIAPGQGIYIAGGGYYTVNSIGDLTHVTVINVGAAGNAAPGATVTGSGTQGVTPAGTPGVAGSNPYTTTSASFTMPTSGASVTVTVGATAFMVAGHYVYVQGAGYFTVASVTDATHAVLTNNIGTSGNVASGTVIAGGAGVTTTGAPGPTGAAGAQGAQGSPGNMTSLGDSVSTASGTEVSMQTGASAGVGSIKKLKAGSNITLTDQGGTTGDVLIAASGGSGSGQPDPATGIFIADDFFFYSASAFATYRALTFGNGAISYVSTYGMDTTKKVNGSVELQTGTNNAAGQGGEFSHGWYGTAAPYGSLVYGLGALVWKTRVFIEGTLPPTGIGYIFRAGIAGSIALGAGHAGSSLPGFAQGFCFAYSPDNNSGQWQIYVGTAAPAAVNTSVTVAGDTAYWLECDVNAAWTSFTFYINGTLVATVTTGLPLSSGDAFWNILRASGSTTSYNALIDAWYLNYQFSR